MEHRRGRFDDSGIDRSRDLELVRCSDASLDCSGKRASFAGSDLCPAFGMGTGTGSPGHPHDVPPAPYSADGYPPGSAPSLPLAEAAGPGGSGNTGRVLGTVSDQQPLCILRGSSLYPGRENWRRAQTGRGLCGFGGAGRCSGGLYGLLPEPVQDARIGTPDVLGLPARRPAQRHGGMCQYQLLPLADRLPDSHLGTGFARVADPF